MSLETIGGTQGDGDVVVRGAGLADAGRKLRRKARSKEGLVNGVLPGRHGSFHP